MSYDNGKIYEGQRRVVRMEGDPRDGQAFVVGKYQVGILPTWRMDFGGELATITRVQPDYLTSSPGRVSRAGAWSSDSSIRQFSEAVSE